MSALSRLMQRRPTATDDNDIATITRAIDRHGSALRTYAPYALFLVSAATAAFFAGSLISLAISMGCVFSLVWMFQRLVTYWFPHYADAAQGDYLREMEQALSPFAQAQWQALLRRSQDEQTPVMIWQLANWRDQLRRAQWNRAMCDQQARIHPQHTSWF
ncbi:MAG: hypothetical protein ING75_05630 [Rhodocyclaceae bacterium]|nr:hypothetical protein [Rhodocyclaceae bacterium]